jgi:hypothetical protein
MEGTTKLGFFISVGCKSFILILIDLATICLAGAESRTLASARPAYALLVSFISRLLICGTFESVMQVN